jgi:hypothetical protein
MFPNPPKNQFASELIQFVQGSEYFRFKFLCNALAKILSTA